MVDTTVRTLDYMDVMWAVRRLPAKARDLLKKHGPRIFLCGGYLRSIVSHERVSDLDLYGDSKDYLEACAKELAGDGKPYITDNAFTVRTKPMPTQFIHRWLFSNAAEAMLTFDFTIAQAAIWWNPEGDGKWHSICSNRFYTDIAAHRLVYTRPKRNEDAGGSILRVLKFYQRGYRIPLDSMGAVIARLLTGVNTRASAQPPKPLIESMDEAWLAKILTGLLREVDPLIDPDHIAHLPSTDDPIEEPVT